MEAAGFTLEQMSRGDRPGRVHEPGELGGEPVRSAARRGLPAAVLGLGGRDLSPKAGAAVLPGPAAPARQCVSGQPPTAPQRCGAFALVHRATPAGQARLGVILPVSGGAIVRVCRPRPGRAGETDGVTGARRIRVGIDTGGTFTDVVAVDEDSGELLAVKTPSTPADPAEGFLTGIRKALAALGAGAGRPRLGEPRHHGGDQPAAHRRRHRHRLHHHRGLRAPAGDRPAERAGRLRQQLLLGQAAPDRRRPTWSAPSAAGSTTAAPRLRPFDVDGARSAARSLRERGVTTIGVCFLHAYANPAHEERMRDILAEEHPDAVVSISHEVLREYREYERAMTTLVDAAVKVRVAAYVTRLRRELDALTRRPRCRSTS